MRFFPLVLKNVFRKRTRTALTVASIVLPLVVICFFGTFVRALDRPDAGATRGMYRLVARHRVSLTSVLPISCEEKIRQVPGVKAATDFTWFGGTYVDKSPRNIFPRFAVDPESFLAVYDDAAVTAGSAQDWLGDRTGALVGENLMAKFGWKLGQKVVLSGDIFPGSFELTVRAVYRLADSPSGALFFHRKMLDEMVPWSRGIAGTIWIRADGAAAAERLPKTIDAMFENSTSPTKTETEKAFQMSFVSMLGNVKALMTSIATIIVLVILLIAANTMAMTARERVTEIAVLRTLGFSRPAILAMVLSEGLLLGLFGGLLGVGLFAFFEPGLKRGLMLSPMASLAASMSLYPTVLFGAFGLALAVGLVAGLVPAVGAARRPIVDGLRQA